MFNALKSFIEKRQTPPPVPVSLTIVVPLEDAQEETTSAAAASNTESAGLTFGIDYEDAKGDESRRRITIKSKNKTHINAYCHERRAPRMFKIENISAIYDLATGEIIEDVGEYLHRVDVIDNGKSARPPEHAKAMGKIRDGARILMWFARCDGVVHPKEFAAVMEFCEEHTCGHDCDREAMKLWVSQLYPDWSTVQKAIRTISKGETRLKLLQKYLGRVLNADEEFDDAEFRALADFQAILEDEQEKEIF